MQVLACAIVSCLFWPPYYEFHLRLQSYLLLCTMRSSTLLGLLALAAGRHCERLGCGFFLRLVAVCLLYFLVFIS